MTIADLHWQSFIKDPPPWGSGSDLVMSLTVHYKLFLENILNKNRPNKHGATAILIDLFILYGHKVIWYKVSISGADRFADLSIS